MGSRSPRFTPLKMRPSCPALPPGSVPDSCQRQTSSEGTKPGRRSLTGHGETREEGSGVASAALTLLPACPHTLALSIGDAAHPRWVSLPHVLFPAVSLSLAGSPRCNGANLPSGGPESRVLPFTVLCLNRDAGGNPRAPQECCSLVGGNRIVLIFFIE